MNSQFSPSDFSASTLEAEFRQIASQRRAQPGTPGPSKSILAAFARHLLDFLTGQQTLSIRQRQLGSGKQQWIVYDPVADKLQIFDTERAVRAWIEQRYYQ